MKKFLAVFAAFALVFALAACGGGGMKDGVYTAEADDAYVAANGYGWRDTLTVTYKDGKVVSAVFESYDADGNKKSVPGNYEGMTPEPSEWIPQLSENLTAAGQPDKVEAVAGASIASANAVKLFEAIVKSGKPGETIKVSL